METLHPRSDSEYFRNFEDFARPATAAKPHALDRPRRPRWTTLAFLGVLVAVLAACSGPADESASSTESAVTGGRWTLSSDALTAGAKVRLTYEGAVKWTGASACGGKLLPGSKVVGGYLMDHFKVITSVGGYACRRNTANTSQMSVHGTGRALDVMVPEAGGAANSAQGDKIANWLVKNAQSIGVDLIIWNRSIWRANGTNASVYGGPIPHTDHVHVELTSEAAKHTTQWFGGEVAGDPDSGSQPDETNPNGTDPELDAATPPVTPHPDAAPPKDAGKDAAPVTPPGEPDAAPTTTPGDGTSEPPVPAPSTGLEVPGDEPGEKNSLPNHPTRPSVHDDGAPTPNSGCSAAPGSQAPTRPLGAGLALMLGLGAWLRRRRARRHD